MSKLSARDSRKGVLSRRNSAYANRQYTASLLDRFYSSGRNVPPAPSPTSWRYAATTGTYSHTPLPNFFCCSIQGSHGHPFFGKREYAPNFFNPPKRRLRNGKFPRSRLNTVATMLSPTRWVKFEFLHGTRGESPLHRLRSYLFVELEFGRRAGFSQRQPSAGRLISVNSVRIFFSGFLLTDPVMMR